MPKPHEPGTAGSFAQLMTRIDETFPAYRNGEWSPLERGVFDGLLANMIQRDGTAAVTGEALERIRGDMVNVVRQYCCWQRET